MDTGVASSCRPSNQHRGAAWARVGRWHLCIGTAVELNTRGTQRGHARCRARRGCAGRKEAFEREPCAEVQPLIDLHAVTRAS